jgi:hypothetical protein
MDTAVKNMKFLTFKNVQTSCRPSCTFRMPSGCSTSEQKKKMLTLIIKEKTRAYGYGTYKKEGQV